ncbi:hypothetical protein A33Q_1970 [Indibacter alkaliphilus LW1]|uniref:Uncharacterized protein n=1 Tax=Indibacter alkaliphilus (strain CCUG 57479 / KCTC 22604 / LW1) TaxID=1189612 RepID=S2DD29_INDAL|nr:hypothetical protein A33Q_1970 [Indibacter alkaliphilus LW1]
MIPSQKNGLLLESGLEFKGEFYALRRMLASVNQITELN